MINIQNVKKQIAGKILFDNVTFHLKPREKVGLIGANGCGKSTLFRTIQSDLFSDAGTISIRKEARIGMLDQVLASGQQTVLARVVSGNTRLQEIQREMDLLQADTEFHEKDPTKWSERFGALQHEFEGLGGYEIDAKAKSILQGLGFKSNQHQQSLQELSGGWKIRVELARLLLQSPDVLLLDEPSNHLDLRSVVWLESYLKSYDGAILLISHDRKFLNSIVSKIAELEFGKLTTYAGNYDKYEIQKAEREALLQSKALNQEKQIAEMERFVERFRAKSTKASQAQSRIKMLSKIERVEVAKKSKSMRIRFPQPLRTGRVTAEIKNMRKSYGSNAIYTNFSASIEKGYKIALVGENGAGKSTLLKILAGSLKQDSGEIKLGHQVTRAYYSQHHSETLTLSHSVLESMDEAAPALNRTEKQNILGSFLFSGEDVDKKISILSGGERSRLALARILAAPAPFLLLDEPTNHLDMRSCEILATALQDFEGTICAISHDRDFLDNIINRVWEIEHGVFKEYIGNYSEYEEAKKREEEKQASQNALLTKEEKPVLAGKEQKRKEAEERNRRYKLLKPLKKKLEKVEISLEEVMEKASNIESTLSDHVLYSAERKEELLQILDQQKELTREEKRLTNLWEEYSEQIESIDQEGE